MASKFSTFLFFVRRPRYFSEAIRRLRHKIGLALLPPPMGQSRRVAESWACCRAVDARTALHRIGIVSIPDLETDFPRVLRESEEKRAACPINMGGGANMPFLYALCEHLRATRVVETGVAYGFSSLAILLSLSKRDGKLFSVDMPYPSGHNDAFVGYVVPEYLRRHWTLLRFPDSIGLRTALSGPGEFDLCHYDSDKSYEGRAWAYPRLWEKLRPGGIFVSDDIGDTTAFRDFSLELGLTPIVVRMAGSGKASEHFVGILIKPDAAASSPA